MTVGEGEVGRVIGHGMTFGLDTHAHVGEREVGVGGLRHSYRLDRVALMTVGSSIECIIELHVVVQWIIFRTRLLLGDGIVEWGRDLRLVGEELTQFDVGSEAIGLIVIGGASCQSFLQSAEALTHHLSCEVNSTEVRELHVERTRGSPSTLVVKLHQAHLVDPYLTRLHL